MGNNITKDTLVSLSIGECPYIAEIVKIEGKDPFLSISGSKKGTRYCGGGIAIYNLHMLDDLLCLMDVISHVEVKGDAQESRVSFFTDRTRFFAGETKCFDDRWFYRIKVYNNNFVNKETGERFFFKGHELRPVGYGKFIQEFDIPISKEGKEFAQNFSMVLFENINLIFSNLFKVSDLDIVNLTRKNLILADGNHPWITMDKGTPLTFLEESLFEEICEYIVEDEYTSENLAAKLNISNNLANYYLNSFSRYNINYLKNGLLIDRIRGVHGNLNFQGTKIPIAALNDSPDLSKLLNESATGKWPAWKRVSFSSDEFPQSKLASLQFATFEIACLLGGTRWEVPLDKYYARVIAVRLFDLKRYYSGDSQGLKTINLLSEQFLNAIKKEQ